MQYSDDEIRQIILERKRAERKERQRKRVITRLGILIALLVMLIAGIIVLVSKIQETRGVIFIDAAHGGMDAGAINGDRQEKDDTLALALKVREKLEELDFTVEMSRTDDTMLTRDEIGLMANDCNAAYMVSLHRNQDDTGEGRGIEIYIPSKNDTQSQTLGNNIMTKLGDVGWIKRNVVVGSLHDSKVDYTENSASKCPSCLVEVGFTSNSDDNKLYDEKLEETADAIAQAISDTFAKYHEK